MDVNQLIQLIQNIVKESKILKDRYTIENDAPVNWCCIFSHGKEEYHELLDLAQSIGKAIEETPTGIIFHINPIETISGNLQLLKIRMPDPTRPEKGDADFTIADYKRFKEQYLKNTHFKLIERPEFEMIELVENGYTVRSYFSHPTQEEVLKLKK